MFKEKIRKVIATFLIICIVMSNNGVAVFANSTSEYYENVEEGGSQQNVTQYYSEYLEEISVANSENNIDNNLEEDIIINEIDEEDKEADEEVIVSEEPEEDFIEDENKNGGNVLSPVGSYDDKEIDEVYEEEPEEDFVYEESDNEDDKDLENETTYAVALDDNNTLNINDEEPKNEESEKEEETEENIESETAEDETIETTEIEESEKETEEVLGEEIVETEEDTEKKDDEEKDEKVNEESVEYGDIDEVNQSTESEVIYKVVKRYIKATVAEVDDFKEHNFKIKKVLLENKNGSLSENLAPEEIDKKYIKKTVKILVEDQYGNEKVVRVKADWNYNFYVIGNEKSEELKKENDEKLKQLIAEGIELKWDEVVDENIEDENNLSYGAEVNEESDLLEEINAKRLEAKQKYFGDTKKDRTNNKMLFSLFANNDDEVYDEIEEDEETSIDDSEYIAEDENVIVVYEDEYVENGEVTEEELSLENPVRGNANSDYLNEENADVLTEAVLDMEKLAVSLQQELKKVYSKSSITVGEDTFDEVPIVNLYGASGEHTHAYCGLTTCDGYSHLKYGQETGTEVQDEIHETKDFIFLPTVSGRTTNDSNIIQGYLTQGAVALAADWVIDRTYTVEDNIFICLNGHSLTFKNDNNYRGVNPSGTGTNYNPGAIVVDASIYAKFSICNCTNTISEVKAFDDGADLTNEYVRLKPCVEVRSLGNAYIFGRPINETTNNLIIKNIYQEGEATSVNSYYNKYSAFLFCTLHSADVITDIRQVRICNVDAKNLVGMAGSIVYANYVNSFAMVDCHIDNCIAAKGPVCNIEYYSNGKSNNDNAIMLGTEIKNSSNYFGYDFAGSTFEQLGHVDYLTTVHSSDPKSLAFMYNEAIGDSPNAFVLLKGYNSIENEAVRQFKYNIFENNKTYGTCSLFHFNSSSEKGSHFVSNVFKNNKSIIDSLTDGRFSTELSENIYKYSALCVTFSNPSTDKHNGDINIYENKFENNDSRYGMYGPAGVSFINLNTVNISNRKETVIVNGDEFKDNKSSYKGSAIAFISVNNVNMAASKIISNTIDVNTGLNITSEGDLGGAVYLENCNNVVIGNRGVDSEIFKVLFDSNKIITNSTDVVVGGAGMHVFNCQTIGLYGTKFVGNNYDRTNENIFTNPVILGGGLYVKASEGFNSHLNIYGNTYNNNSAQSGGGVYADNVIVTVADFLNYTNRNLFTKNTAYGLTDRNFARGGGVFIDPGYVDHETKITYVDFGDTTDGNYAKFGGALYISNNINETTNEYKVSNLHKVTMTNTLFQSANVDKVTEISEMHGGAIYAEHANIDIYEKLEIKKNFNAIYLKDDSIFTSRYSETYGAINQGKLIETPEISENIGDYLFGFGFGSSVNLNSIVTYNLFGGGIKNNTLNPGITDYRIPTNTGYNAGLFGYYDVNGTGRPEGLRINVNIAGALNLLDNKRGELLHNIPLEQGTNKWIKLSMGTDDYQLGYTAKVAFTPFDVTPLAGATGAEGYRLFTDEGEYADDSKYHYWTDIKDVDKGGSPQSVFRNDRNEDTLDSRASFVDQFNKILFENEAMLITYEFDMITHTDMQIAPQKVSAGSTLYKPFKPQAITEDGGMLVNEEHTVRALDIMGRVDDDFTFAPWDFDKTIEINEHTEEEPTNLYLIYQLLSHKHKVCGGESESCSHLDGANHYESYGFFGDESNMFDDDHACVEVAAAQQLFYAFYYPQYMYVLTRDVVIPEKIYGRDTSKFISFMFNEGIDGIKNLKLCLNGYKLTIENNVSFFSVAGDSYICDCSLNETNHSPAISFNGSELSSFIKLNVHRGESNLSIYGTQDLYDKIKFENFKIGSGNMISRNLSEDEVNGKVYVEYAEFNDNELKSSLIDNTGSVYFDHVDFNRNKIKDKVTTYSSDPDVMFENAPALVKAKDDGSSIEHEFNASKFVENEIEVDYGGIVLLKESYTNTSFDMEQNEFRDNITKGYYPAVALTGKDNRSVFNILESTFDNNTGGAIMIENYNSVSIAISNIEKCIFNENKLILNEDSKRLGGGAVYVSGVGEPQIDPGHIVFTGNEFTNNEVRYSATTANDLSKGGALYISNSQTVESDSDLFSGNIAKYGSAIYDNQEDMSNMPFTIQRRWNKVIIRENGEEDNTQGSYYLNIPVSNNMSEGFVDLTMENNKGLVPGFYIENIHDGNTIKLEGNAKFNENTGGPVIYAKPTDSTKHNGTIEFDTENLNMTQNTVGNRNVIEVSGKDVDGSSAVDATTTIRFRGIVRITENLNTSGQESNIRVSKNLVLDAFNKKLNATKFEGEYRSKIGVNTTTDILEAVKDEANGNYGEINMFTWTPAVINGFASSGIMSEEIVVVDEKVKSTDPDRDIVVFKGTKDQLAIGYKKITKEIRAYLSDTIVYKTMHARLYNTDVYLDNFADLSTLRTLIPEEYSGSYTNINPLGWMSTNTTFNFVTWSFNSTKYIAKNDTNDGSDVYALWQTPHGHTSTNITHADNTTNWFITYDKNILFLDLDRKYVMSKDLTLDTTIKNTVNNYTICLNGNSLTTENGIPLVNLIDNTKPLGFSVINCKNEGMLSPAADEAIENKEPFINLVSTSDNDTGVLNITNIVIDNFNYKGTIEGAIVHVEYGRLNINNLTIEKDSDTKNAYSEVPLIYTMNCIYNHNGLSIKDLDDLKIKNGIVFVTLDDTYRNVARDAGTTIFNFTGEMTIENNKINTEGLVSTGKDNNPLKNMSLFRFKNILSPVNITVEGDSRIVDNEVGSIFLLDNVSQFTFEGAVDADGNSLTEISNNECMMNAVVKVEDSTETDQTLSFKNVDFKGNHATYFGSVLQYISDYQNEKGVSASFNNVDFEENETSGIYYSASGYAAGSTRGGAIFIGNSDANHPAGKIKNVLSITNTKSIKDNKVVQANYLESNDENKLGGGGFIYAQRTKVTIAPKDGGTLNIEGNTAEKDNGASFTKTLSSDSYNEQLAQGGVAVLSNCIFTLGGNGTVNVKNNKADDVSAFYIISDLFGGTEASSVSENNMFNIGSTEDYTNGVVNITENEDSQNGGAVKIKGYMSFTMNNTVVIATNSTTKEGIPFVRNFYAADNVLRNEVNMSRKILTGFNYDNSFICGDNDYPDDYIATGFLATEETKITKIFKADDEENDIVYPTDDDDDPSGGKVVHIGNSRMEVRFILGPGVTVRKNDDLSVSYTTETKDTTSAVQAPLINGYIKDMNQSAMYSASSQLKNPLNEWTITRSGYTLEGWVAWIYNHDVSERRQFGTLDNFDTKRVYGKAEDGTILNVYAVWSNNEYNGNVRACGNVSCSHETGVNHSLMQKWIETVRQETLYYESTNMASTGFYNDSPTGYIEVDMSYGPIKSRVLNVSGMQKKPWDYTGYAGGNGPMLVDNNTFVILVNKKNLLDGNTPLFVDHDIILSVKAKEGETDNYAELGDSINIKQIGPGIYPGAATLDLSHTPEIKYSIGGLTDNLYQGSNDMINESDMTNFDIIKSETGTIQIYGTSDRHFNLGRFGSNGVNKIVKAKSLILENTDFVRNVNMQIETEIIGVNIYDSNMYLNKFVTVYPATDSVADPRELYSFIKLKKGDKAGVGNVKNVLAYKNTIGQYIYLDMPTLTNAQNLNLDFSKTITYNSNEITGAKENMVFSVNNAEGEKLDTAFIGAGPNDDTSVSSNTSNPLITLSGTLDKNYTGSDYFDYLIDSYGTSLTLASGSTIKDNTVNKDLIRVAHGRKNLSLKMDHATITGNIVTPNAVDAMSQGYVIRRDSPQAAEDRIYDSVIKNNIARFAFYNVAVSGMNKVELGGRVEIYENFDIENKPANLAITDHQTTQTLAYSTENKLNYKSKIGVSVLIEGRRLTESEGYVSYRSWTYGMRAGNNEEALNIGGTTDSVFVSDDENYVVYKTTTNDIKIIRKNEKNKFVEVHYEYYADVEETFSYQYVAVGAVPDHPGVPVAKSGETFIGWYTSNKEDSEEFDFTGTTTPVKNVGTIATMYAIWDREVKMTVHRNGPGHKTLDDGSTINYGNIIDYADPFSVDRDVVYVGRMGDSLDTIINNVIAGNEGYEAYTIDDSGNKLDDITTIVEYRRDGTAWSVNGWWTKNGWNDGAGDGDWGEKFDPTSGQIIVETVDYYVRWVGRDVTLYLNLQDNNAGGDDFGSTDAELVDGTYEEDAATGNPIVVLHYLTTIDKLPEVTRSGYKFVAWHSAPRESFSEANIIKPKQYLALEGGEGSNTLYAEWEPIKYTVVFMPDENTDKFSFATPSQVLTFDKTEQLIKNRYTRIGYEIDHWDYFSEELTGDRQVPDGHMFNDEDWDNLTGVDGATVKLYVNWHPENFSITFALNDKKKGDDRVTEGYYLGTTTSEDDEEVFSEDEGTPVHYGDRLGNIRTLPNPTREGYQFGGWWTNNDGTGVHVTNDTLYTFESATYINSDGATRATNSTLYAKWIKNKYKVVFDTNRIETDGLEPVGEMEKLEAYFDTPVTIPINKFKSNGFTFTKMTFENDDRGVVYDINNKNAVVEIDETSDLYNFGYNKENLGIGTGSEIVLYAQWNMHKYNLKYVGNPPSGRELKPNSDDFIRENISYTDDVELIDGEDKWTVEGYAFDKWTLVRDIESATVSYIVGDVLNKLASIEPDNDTVETFSLYAQWVKNPYYISYNAGEAGDGEDDVVGSLNTQRLSVDDDEVELYPISGGNYTNLDGTTVNAGPGFSVVGYTFDHWRDTTTGITYNDKALVKNIRTERDAEAEFEANWKPNTYKLVFDKNIPISSLSGATNEAVGSNYYEMLSSDKIYNPSRPASIEHSGQMIEYPADVTVDLIDSQDDPKVKINGYIMTGFIGQDGEVFRTGNDMTFNRKAGTSSVADSTYELKYTWTPGLFSLELDYNDNETSPVEDDSKDSIKVYYDRPYNSYESFVEPKRPGYDFVGWTLNRAYGPKETPSADDLISTKSILRKYNLDPTDEETPVDILYAYWIPKKYTLKVNANNLNGQVGHYKIATTTNAEGFTKELEYSIVVEYEQPIGELDTAYLQGYKFTRYDKSNEGDEEEVTKDTLYWAIEDQTIYAIYNPITYKVVFKASASDVDGSFNDLTLTYDADPYQLPNVDETVTITPGTVGNMNRKGYTFLRWEHTTRVASPNNINTNNQRYYENEDEISNLQETENAVAELSAMWQEHKYTIVYDSNAPESPDTSFTNTAVGNMADVNLSYTEEYIMPVASYSIVGYKFIGWALTANATEPDYKAGDKVSKLASKGCGDENDNEELTIYAVWENEVYTITLNINDSTNGNGTTVASYETEGQKTQIKIAYDTIYRDAYILDASGNKTQQNIGVIEVQGDQDVKAKRDGYRFMGWSERATIPYAERANNLINYDEVYRLADDSVVYAVWENNQYTMTFETNTRLFGAGEPENPTEQRIWFDMLYGENEISGSSNLPVMNFPPYTFGGWFLEKDATWDFTAPDGAPSDVTRVVLNHKKLTADDFDAIDSEGNVKAYAYWGGTLFTIVMDANGGKVYDEPTNTMADKTTTNAIHQLSIKDGLGHLYTENEEVTIAGVTQKKVYRTGYDFKGWWSLRTDPYPYSTTDDIEITDDTVYWNAATGSTVHAKWEANKYDITYVVNLPQGSTTTGTVEYTNGLVSPTGLLRNIELTYDQNISGTSTFAKVAMKGYTFLGWYTREDKNDNSGMWLSGERASASYIWKYEDITKIYGQWDVNSYVITWDMNKGEGSTDPIMTSGKSTTSQVFDTDILATSAPKVEREGYTFDGFYTKQGIWAGADGWDSTSSDNNGWGDRVDLGKLKYDISIVNLNGGEAADSTFYARWIPKEYTITFDGNKGSATTDPYIGGKNTNVSRKILFDDSLSRYRYDKEITNTIPSAECDTNFYDENKDVESHYDKNDTTLPFKTIKEGYTFKGWNTKQDGTGDFIGAGIPKDTVYVATTNTTYYAIWEANQYIISFVKNDSSDGLGSTTATLDRDNVQVSFDEKVPELPNPTRDGYEFIGWWTRQGWMSDYYINSDAQYDRDWGMKIVEDVNTYNFVPSTGIDLLIKNGNNYAENITLYARWKRKTYNIIYNVNASDVGNGSTEGKLYVNNVEQTGTTFTLDKVYFDLPVIYGNDTTLANRTNEPTAKRLGYDFANWIFSDSTDIFDINTYVYQRTTDMQVKADWTRKMFTITYGSNIYDEVRAMPGNTALKSQLTHSSLNGETDVVDIPNPAYFNVEFDTAMSNLLTTSDTSSDLWPKLRSTGNRYGYTFTDFYTKQGKEQGVKLERTTVLNNDLLSQFAQAITMDTNSLVIYPNWKAHTYKISFDKNINLSSVTPETMPDITGISFNEFKELPDNTFSELGFEFLGWNETPITDYSGTIKPKYYVTNGVKPMVYRLVDEDNGSATLYATWKVANIPITYKNVFEGDAVPEVAWDKSANSHLPYWFNMMGNTDGGKTITTPVRRGSKFEYWELPNGATTSEAININDFLDERVELVLKAHWSTLKYYVIFDPNGGTGVQVSVQVIEGAPYTIPNFGFTMPNHYISYWSTSKTGRGGRSYTLNQTINNLSDMAKESEGLVFYAMWSSNTTGVRVKTGGTGGGGGGGGGGGAARTGGGVAIGGVGIENSSSVANNTYTPGASLAINSANKISGNWVYEPNSNEWYFQVNNNVKINQADGASSISVYATNGIYSINEDGQESYYAFDSTGAMVKGLYNFNNKTYYFSPGGNNVGKMQQGWQVVSGRQLFFGTDGALATNTTTPDGYVVDAVGNVVGKESELKRNEARQNSPIKGTEVLNPHWDYDSVSHTYRLRISDTQTASNGWYTVLVDNRYKIYKFNSIGVMQTGMVDDGGYTYYLSEKEGQGQGEMLTGVVSIAGTEFFFNDGSYNTVPYGALVKNTTFVNGWTTDQFGVIHRY